MQTILNLAPGPLPAHAELTAIVSFTTFRGQHRIDCRTEPDGCVAAVVTATDPLGSATVVASAFDELVFVTQCDNAIVDEPTLGGALTHCANGPVTRPVTVAGSTLDAPLDVHATLHEILGGTTDCTVAPRACVVGLVRLERDGSLSTHLTPIAFA